MGATGCLDFVGERTADGDVEGEGLIRATDTVVLSVSGSLL